MAIALSDTPQNATSCSIAVPSEFTKITEPAESM